MDKPALKYIVGLIVIALVVIVIGSVVASYNKTAKANAAKETATKQSPTTPASTPKAQYELGQSFVKIYTNSIGARYVIICQPIINVGQTNLALNMSSFDVENPDGTIARSCGYVMAHPNEIKPGETGYYYDQFLYYGTVTEGLRLVPHLEIKSSSNKIERFEVGEVQIQKDMIGYTIVGRVENSSNQPQKSIYVVAKYYDSNDNFIGLDFNITSGTVQPGEKIGFQIAVSPYNEQSDVQNIRFVAY